MDESAVGLLSRVEALLPAMQGRAAALDADAAFPAADVAALGAAGAFHAAVPQAWGGLGLGTEAAGAARVLALLRLVGRGNLALGRLLEAHINALRLVFRYGDDALRDAVAHEARDKNLFALWVTDAPGSGLVLHEGGVVCGVKRFCSGAGHVTRAIVTAADATGSTRLAHVRSQGGVGDQGMRAGAIPGGLAGMRAATTGEVVFDRAAATVFGEPGDYLREPDFSCGAWRTSAVTLGGLEALCEQLRHQLVARGRESDPHQQARFGQVLIAVETARLWMDACAARAESADADPPGAVAYVGLARVAVERACLEVMELVQRSLGVAALMRNNPAERLCRDLATYLRQPAADAVLTEAAAAALHPSPR